MFVTVIALIYALLVSQCSYVHFLKLTDLILFEQDAKSSLFNSTHHIVLYPQNGDRIVTIDSVTSLHPVYSQTAVHFSSSAIYEHGFRLPRLPRERGRSRGVVVCESDQRAASDRTSSD